MTEFTIPFQVPNTGNAWHKLTWWELPLAWLLAAAILLCFMVAVKQLYLRIKR